MSPTADAFSAMAPLWRVRPQIQQVCRFGAQWLSGHDAERGGWVPFHIVTHGRCLLSTPGQPGILLRTGDVALLPHGGEHILYSLSAPPALPDAAARTRPARQSAAPRVRRLRSGVSVKTNTTAEPDTGLICGRLRLEHARDNMVLAVLPRVIVVAATDQHDDAEPARALAQAMRREIEADRPGAAAIATDLASALMLTVLRAYLQRPHAGADVAGSHGVLALLQHRGTGRALACVLADPGRAWTLDALALEAGTSRATLVRLFQRFGGSPPLAFFMHLRLRLARARLADSREPIAAIAAQFGYQSESAFSRAYRRRFGAPPGSARRARNARTTGGTSGTSGTSGTGGTGGTGASRDGE